MENNIRAILAQATAQEWAEGHKWYAEAQTFAKAMAGEFTLPVPVVAAVIAALSPSNRWGRNKVDARNLIAAWSAGLGPDDVSVSTYGPNKRLAFRILAEQDPDLLSGQKVQAFAANIAGDLSRVTVDRHAYNAALGLRAVVDDKGPRITAKRCLATQAAYTAVAMEYGLQPAQLQAIVWLAWRRAEVPSKYLDA